MTERLICLRDIYPVEQPARKQKHAQWRLNNFTAALLRDAMDRKLCNLADALSAVYISGLLHGMELGPRVLKEMKNEKRGLRRSS